MKKCGSVIQNQKKTEKLKKKPKPNNTEQQKLYSLFYFSKLQEKKNRTGKCVFMQLTVVCKKFSLLLSDLLDILQFVFHWSHLLHLFVHK